MKKLATLLFAFALAFTLSMPSFAQEAGSTEAAPKAEKGAKKEKKMKHEHEKGAKKEKKEKKGEEAPPKS